MIHGSCHCGKLSWRLEDRPESATACNCTLCRRYGALWAYGEDGSNISFNGESADYIHGDRYLGFQFCRDCGCVIGFRALALDENGKSGAAVNLRMAEPDTVADIPIRHFNGLEWQSLGQDGRCVKDLWF